MSALLRPCIFITTCSLALILLQLGVDALPLNQTELHERAFSYPPLTHSVWTDPRRYLLGYRYVSPEKAAEYNSFPEALTSIPASGTQLGEGAYLSPRLGMFPGRLPPDFWECVVTGSEQALKMAPKLFVANTAGTNRNPRELARYIHDHGYSHYGTEHTILFSEHHLYLAMNNYQMLIPPAYLVPSPSFPGVKGGFNFLQTRVACLPMGCMGLAPSAGWHAWNIEYWPKAVRVRAEKTEKQHCSAAPAAPPASSNGKSVAHGAPSTNGKKGKRNQEGGVSRVEGITTRGTSHETAKTSCPVSVIHKHRSWLPPPQSSTIRMSVLLRPHILITTYSLVLILLQLGVDAFPLGQTQSHERSFPSPLKTGTQSVTIGPERVLLGYRYVHPDKAKEYNTLHEVTSIPATDVQLGQGAYLSPRLNMFPGRLPEDFWECVVTASKKALDKAPKLFVTDTAGTNRDKDKLARYIAQVGANYDIEQTILFSEHHLVKNNYQMLIPAVYLVPSPGFPGVQGGCNSLETRVECVPMGCMGYAPSAEWEAWGIRDWPIRVRFHVGERKEQQCSAAWPPVALPVSSSNRKSVAHSTPSPKKKGKKEQKGTVKNSCPARPKWVIELFERLCLPF
ncbi:hypothetical protein BDP27DRAFT_1450470 [Rhodocollybia butyracea]|uniref:Uncharacterized protein n=1 Tax=Rhodocollybia butyracea TaxID=206335 RepID=A0A9P5PKH9_9AGAR|nr:hypothetical protein BDP27DRAFT_1450470 [Rhodocollybia butyracea]